jgi:hypothetical protein
MDKAALVGAGWRCHRLATQSADLDKALTPLRHSAGTTKDEAALLRKELFRMSRETDRNVDELQGGFSHQASSGFDLASAKESTDASKISPSAPRRQGISQGRSPLRALPSRL